MTVILSSLRARRGLLTVAAWVAVTVLVALLPVLGLSLTWTRQVILVAIFSLLVIGLNLNLGWAGELNMGLPAMYAAGAYVAAYTSARVVDDIVVCLVLAGVAATVVGLAAGAPGLRLGGWMLAVGTFLLVLLIPTTLQVIPSEILGGTSGFTGIPTPKLLGVPLSRQGFFAVVIVVTSLWFAVYRNAVRSSFGNELLILQSGQVLGPSLGMSRYRLKLITYALASMPMGMAGALFAFNDRFVSPESLGIHLVINVLVASIVAGRRSIFAIFVGVAFVQLITTQSTRFGEFGEVAFGLFLIVGGIAFGAGVSGLTASLLRRLRPRGARTATDDVAPDTRPVPEVPPMDGRDVRLDGVSKTFGGATAVKSATFTAGAGRITALIGPNGSGKTTTLNIINGFIKPTNGRVVLGDRDVTGRSVVTLARSGVARTFQTPMIPIQLTVLDAVASGRLHASSPSLLSTVLRLPSYRRIEAENRAIALRWLDVLGLRQIAGERAADMALGTRRMIELARALCERPSVLLLDEVASGLDHDEVVELADVLRRVRDAGATVILVEHNFSLVRSLADHVVVLADGAVLTEGTPQDVAEHPEVLERFLGTGAGVSGTTIGEEPGVGTAVEGGVRS